MAVDPCRKLMSKCHMLALVREGEKAIHLGSYGMGSLKHRASTG